MRFRFQPFEFRPLTAALSTALFTMAARAVPVLMPSQITPPAEPPTLRRVDPGALTPPEAVAPAQPALTSHARVVIDHVELKGALLEVDEANQAFVRSIKGQDLSLQDIQDRMQALEAQYALKGYILCRVLLPPQQLRPHGTLRVTVLDGFIESAEMSGLDPRVASRVQGRLSDLVARRPITVTDLEQALMAAQQVPGVTLRSAMARGDMPGGVKLLVDGAFQPYSISAYADNRLSKSLGGAEYGLGLVHRPLLPFLDEFSLNLTGSADWWRSPGRADAPGRFVAVQMKASTQIGRSTSLAWLSATHSEAQPRALVGVPVTLGQYDQFSLGVGLPLVDTRAAQGTATVEWVHTAQSIELPALNALFSQDRYESLRLGAQYTERRMAGLGWTAQGVLALGVRGRDRDTTPPSHTGADDNFKRILLSLDADWPFIGASSLRAVTKYQSTFNAPVFVSEQLALSGSTGVSALKLNGLSVDEGWTVRGEWLRGMPSGLAGSRLVAYLFADHVLGTTHQAGLGQRSFTRLSEAGVGARWFQSLRQQSSAQIGVEMGYRLHGLADQVGHWGLGIYVNFSIN